MEGQRVQESHQVWKLLCLLRKAVGNAEVLKILPKVGGLRKSFNTSFTLLSL